MDTRKMEQIMKMVTENLIITESDDMWYDRTGNLVEIISKWTGELLYKYDIETGEIESC